MINERHIDNMLKEARVVAEMSPDMQTKVGCVMFDPETKTRVLSSYNGFVDGACHDDLPKSGPLKYPYMIHAEHNAILQGAFQGIQTRNKHLVCTLSPCRECMRFLHRAGIKTIYFQDYYRDFTTEMLDLDIDLTKYKNYSKLVIKPKE